MNPGKVVDPYPVTENLRLGADFAPHDPVTHFHFAHDEGSFTRASMRCVGVGECRRQEHGTMCPSYRATMEEKHSTRGRAHMLFEMMRGEVIRDGWKSEEVFDALDLCLSCKGCKGDCPVNVDMATYKAEFLSHYYAGRLRPRYAYAMGWIHRWARLASLAPEIANWIGGMSWAKALGGIAPQRATPKFAPVTFKQWFRERSRFWKLDRKGADGAPEVILWADTFNNHFPPRVAIAATEVLEAAGFRVLVPRAPLCCGRPLYDYGFLDQAESLLIDIVRALKPKIEAGVPLVALEPSCLAVFRDEMLDLLPHDQDAKRLHAQSFTLAEFLTKHDYHPPRLERDLIVHGHCHQKSIIGMGAEKQLFEAMGARGEILDDGCCGMAGSFGFEPHKYEVSMKVYDHELGPRLHRAEAGAVVLADGFSCKTQIEQETGRRPLHLAELLRGKSHDALAELESARRARLRTAGRAASAAAIGIAAAFLVRRLTRR
jgi:Fe-S oxidoreductase